MDCSDELFADCFWWWVKTIYFIFWAASICPDIGPTLLLVSDSMMINPPCDYFDFYINILKAWSAPNLSKTIHINPPKPRYVLFMDVYQMVVLCNGGIQWIHHKVVPQVICYVGLFHVHCWVCGGDVLVNNHHLIGFKIWYKLVCNSIYNIKNYFDISTAQ